MGLYFHLMVDKAFPESGVRERGKDHGSGSEHKYKWQYRGKDQCKFGRFPRTIDFIQILFLRLN